MKKYYSYILAAFFAVFFLFCSSMSVSASESSDSETDTAVKDADRVTISVKDVDGESYSELTDRNFYTKYKASKKIYFNVKGKKEFSSIYVVVDTACKWKVELPDGTVLEGGQNGFIHEYMELGQSVQYLIFTLPRGATLCDICAFTDGEPPSWVQRWEPPCEEADLLVLPTHADDEYLWFGGAMPYYAGELGYKVQVAYMTNHSRQPYREHERLNGLWTVGITNYPIISNFVDLYASKASLESAEEIYDVDEVTAWQVEQIRRFKPKVIIGHDINGEYGHGAHKLNAKTLLEALKISNDASYYPESAEKYGTYEVQKCYIHLWEENQIQVEWEDMVLSKFGGKTALKVASEGFACHKSQIEYYDFNTYTKKYDCRKFGLAYTTVGLDTEGANDMFENVVWEQPEVEEVVSESDAVVSDSDNESKSGFNQIPVEWIAAAICIISLLVIIIMIVCHYAKQRKRKQ